MSNYGYVKKNKNVKGIVIAAFICLICLSAIAVGVTSLSRRNNRNERETEDVVDLNNVKKNNTDSNNDSKASEDETDGSQAKNETDNRSDTSDMNDSSNKGISNSNLSNTEKNQPGNDEDIHNLENSENIAANGQVTAVTEEQENLTNNAQNSPQSSDTGADISDIVADVSALVATYAFNESDILEWPVRGNVILDYSMDSTIYFPTLDSYRCNPAIVIQSENGTSVFAGVNGVVEEISSNDEIGKYVVVGIGSGYEVTYGQLENIAVSVGTVVEPGTAIGVVGEVTRYYKNEGPNVYYEVTKDGIPCDPLDYLR